MNYIPKNFQKGQKVVCIEPHSILSQGEIYTIKNSSYSVYPGRDSAALVKLEEVSWELFYEWRFELINLKRELI